MKRKKRTMVLCLDPSLAAFGYSVVSISTNKVLNMGCIKTSPEDKKLRIRKGDDRMRRISEITRTLINVIENYNIKLVFSELPHGSQSAVAALSLGMVSGMVQALCDALKISLEWYSEADSKNAVLHKRSSTKREMINKIDSIYSVPWTGIGYKDEAVADSLAIYYTAEQNSPTLKMLKNEFS